MNFWAVGCAGLAALACSACGGGADPPAALPTGLTVLKTDVRIGLTADDQTGGRGVLKGQGFEQLETGGCIAMIENGGGSGTLNDSGNAIAIGTPADSLNLAGSVFAKPAAEGGTGSAAQVVELSTTVLEVAGDLPKVRVELDAQVRVLLVGKGNGFCELVSELTLDGNPVATAKSQLHFYGQDGEVGIYDRPPRYGMEPAATIKNGGVHTFKVPSFYFKLGPGAYHLSSTMKLSAACPADAVDSAASIEALAKIGVR